MMFKTLGLAVLMLAATPLAAHDPKLHAKEAAERAAAEAKAAVHDAGVAVTTAVGAMAGTVSSTAAAVVQAPPLDVLRASLHSHLHNKIVHFPIALGFFGALFFLLSLRWPNYLWPTRVLLASALAGALAAAPTGWAQTSDLDGTSLQIALQWHMHLGQASIVLLALSLLLTFFPSARKWSWVVPVLLVLVLAVTGAFGGALAHS